MPTGGRPPCIRRKRSKPCRYTDHRGLFGDQTWTENGHYTDGTRQYSHILDEDRRLNAQRFEEEFYSGKKTAGKEEVPYTVPEAGQVDDMTTLTKLLANPETAGLLKALVKAMDKENS